MVKPTQVHAALEQGASRLLGIEGLAVTRVDLEDDGARVAHVVTDDEFAAAVHDIDRRMRAEIRERQRHRERVAQLAAGDSLALPPAVVTYLHRMRELGFRERVVEIERDSWILIAVQAPDQAPALMPLNLDPPMNLVL